MRRRRAARGAGNIGCVLWLIVLVAVGHVLWKVVPVKIRSSEFYDVMQEQASFGSIKSEHQIQYEILRRAQELKIPVTKENLKIVRDRQSVTVEAHYSITIEFFGGAYKYVWKFDPVVTRPTFAV
ncbi:MAG TPA: hypothetical protein VGK08_07940 [Thermoanaerobaculia bacterium]|jgi:hypothetical protein